MKRNKLNKSQLKEVKSFSKKLEAYYELFNWNWRDSEYTPTASEIERTIINLCNDKDLLKHGQISTGGLTVELDCDECLTITWGPMVSLYL